MALVTHKFKLDLTPGAARQVLYTSQGDIGRPFEADLYWNGSPWTATGTTASIRGKKPDDTVFDYTATVSGTAVTFETTEQMTIISGPVECELVFSNGGDIIASANFVLMVEDSPYDPNALSESDIPTIGDLIEDTIGGDIRDEVGALIEAHPELMLQDNSVTTPKIAAGAVTEGKIASNAVTTGKLATGAVTSAKVDADFLKTIENAYVTPEQFGAVGDGTTDDSAAFLAALQYIDDDLSFDTNEHSTTELWLTKSYYLGSNITIPSRIQTLTVRGLGNAKIKGNGFSFSDTVGHDVLFIGICFLSCNNPIFMAYRNSEYGSYTVEKCIFRGCTGVCVDIRRRSCFITIRDCFFKNNEKTAYIQDGDNFTFEHNWVEHNATVSEGYCNIEHSCPHEGNAHIINNFFVPASAQSTQCYWVRTGKDAEIRENRFSGENKSMYPVLIEYDLLSSFNINQTNYPVVNFVNNPMVNGNTEIVLGEFVGRLNVSGNSGYPNGISAIKYKNATVETYYTNLNRERFFFYLGQNAGRTFNTRGSMISAPYPIMPTSLIRFISHNDWALVNRNNNLQNLYFEKSISGATLSIKFPYIANVATQASSFEGNGQFFVQGSVNYNPGGNGNYRILFSGILTFKINYSGGVIVTPIFDLITGENTSLTYTPTINGLSTIPYADASAAIQNGTFNLELTITSTTNNATVKYYNVSEMADFERVNNYRLL